MLGTGFDPTRALVLSQVLLSTGIPFALIPLAAYTSNRTLMGPFTNTRATILITGAVTSLIVLLNVALIGLTIAGAA